MCVCMYLCTYSMDCSWENINKHVNSKQRSLIVKYLYIQLMSDIWFGYRFVQRSRTLQWHHNGRDSVSNHQPHDCLLNRLFRRRWKKTSKLRVTGFCVGNSSGTGEFPAQMASSAENVSIWWRHHDRQLTTYCLNDVQSKASIDKFWDHWGLMTYSCVYELGYYWSRQWLVTCSATSHFQN